MEYIWTFPATLVKNYDGDTLSLRLDLGFAVALHADVRLDGVDTPELRGGTPETKALAKLARDQVTEFCRSADELIFRPTLWAGKYGRPIGDLVCDGQSLVQYLIDKRLGVPYGGGSRKSLQAAHQINAKFHLAKGE